MELSPPQLAAHGTDIARYIIAAAHKTQTPAFEMNDIFKENPETGYYLGGVLHHIASDTASDVLMNQSGLRFLVLDTGRLDPGRILASGACNAHWSDIKRRIDAYFGLEPARMAQGNGGGETAGSVPIE